MTLVLTLSPLSFRVFKMLRLPSVNYVTLLFSIRCNGSTKERTDCVGYSDNLANFAAISPVKRVEVLKL